MSDEDTTTLETPEVETPEVAPIEDSEPQVFTAEYVKELRQEAAAHRVKAKRIDEANQRLLQSIVQIDGRLINADDLPLTENMLDESGLADATKVQEAIHELVKAKPYLASRKPISPLPQGVLSSPKESPSLFALVRERI